MKLRSIKRHLAMFGVNHLFAGTRCFRIKRFLLRAAGYDIGENTKIVGPVFCTGTLKIGSNTWVGWNLTVHGNGYVEIGSNCDLAPDVMFLTGGHTIGEVDRRAGRGETYSISVGDGSWIGARVTIGSDVCIGKGSVVASCACVMSDVKENMMVGGVPAKLIRELEDDSQPSY